MEAILTDVKRIIVRGGQVVRLTQICTTYVKYVKKYGGCLQSGVRP